GRPPRGAEHARREGRRPRGRQRGAPPPRPAHRLARLEPPLTRHQPPRDRACAPQGSLLGCTSAVSEWWGGGPGSAESEELARLALERVADRGEGREADRAGAVVLQHREIDDADAHELRQPRERHPALLEQLVEAAVDATLVVGIG